MNYIEITVQTTSAGTEAVSALLMAMGAQGTQIIDRADVPDADKPHGYWELIDENLKNSLPECPEVKAWFAEGHDLSALTDRLSFLRQDMGDMAGSLRVSRQGVAEEDWAESWKQYYKPFHIANTLVVKPGWEPYTPQPGEKVIDIDPGMAFGTGTHETTALCAELLEAYAVKGTVLDIGTGSGILAMAAALLGADHVLAVDIDPVAVRVATENIKKAGMEDIVTVRQGDLMKGLSVVADAAVANILADVIIMLAGPLKKQLKKDGLFICSGIILEREQDVLDALVAEGYQVVETRHKGAWSAVVARA